MARRWWGIMLSNDWGIELPLRILIICSLIGRCSVVSDLNGYLSVVLLRIFRKIKWFFQNLANYSTVDSIVITDKNANNHYVDYTNAQQITVARFTISFLYVLIFRISSIVELLHCHHSGSEVNSLINTTHCTQDYETICFLLEFPFHCE